MKPTIYDYKATEEIKQIVIGIQQLRCRHEVEKHSFVDNIDRSFIVERAKEDVKHELLDHIKDFILVEEINDGFYIEAELHLPYVRDSKIKELEDTVYFWEKSSRRAESEITALCKRIRLLERPWWKKLIDWVRL